MPPVQIKIKTTPSKKTVDRQQSKAARQQGKRFISKQLEILDKQFIQFPVREHARYINV